jgi:phosphoribosylformimino-5-aminoimidazole carboxamide ribotide isomerase
MNAQSKAAQPPRSEAQPSGGGPPRSKAAQPPRSEAQPSGGIGLGGTFELIPAIDLLAGRCVRLEQGDYARATVYRDDPAEQAAAFAAHPIPRLHVVDLDGAREGVPRNADAVRRVVASAGRVPVQLGGGIRSLAAVEAALATGADRVVLGTAALRDPELLAEACRRHPGRVAVGIDAREGRVAVAGWLETTATRALDLARRAEAAGAAAIVYTDIARDGMLAGPNLAAAAEVAAAVGIPVIASGGIGSEADLERAAATPGLAGAIVGKALYTGAVDLGRALRRLACS